MQFSEPQVIANEQCHCGENPLWDDRHGLLYWTDIDTGRLFCWDSATGRHEKIYHDEPVGGFTLQEDGTLLLFRADNIAHRAADRKVRVLRSGIDPEMVRFNDVIADPQGRVYAGTIGTQNRGGVYRVEPDLSITRLFQGTECSNGMEFSLDLRQMYWTCSSSNRLFRFNYDRATGAVSEQTVLVHPPADAGILDGLAIDTAGNLWSARWDGAAIHNFSPAGEEIGVIRMPVKLSSSITFGGKDLTDMFITSAGAGGVHGADDNPLNGATFRVRSDVRGRPAFRSRIRT